MFTDTSVHFIRFIPNFACFVYLSGICRALFSKCISTNCLCCCEVVQRSFRIELVLTCHQFQPERYHSFRKQLVLLVPVVRVECTGKCRSIMCCKFMSFSEETLRSMCKDSREKHILVMSCLEKKIKFFTLILSPSRSYESYCIRNPGYVCPDFQILCRNLLAMIF